MKKWSGEYQNGKFFVNFCHLLTKKGQKKRKKNWDKKETILPRGADKTKYKYKGKRQFCAPFFLCSIQTKGLTLTTYFAINWIRIVGEKIKIKTIVFDILVGFLILGHFFPMNFAIELHEEKFF